jgi:hypothetical protein
MRRRDLLASATALSFASLLGRDAAAQGQPPTKLNALFDAFFDTDLQREPAMSARRALRPTARPMPTS